MKLSKGFLAAFWLCVAVMVLYLTTSSKETTRTASPPTPQQSSLSDDAKQKLEETVAVFRKQRFLYKFDVELNTAYVDPDLWTMMDVDQKTQAATTLAFYCGWKRGNNLNWVELRHPMTGKRLGKYSQVWGMTIDQ